MINYNSLPPNVQWAIDLLSLDKQPGRPGSHLTTEQKLPSLEGIAEWLLNNVHKADLETETLEIVGYLSRAKVKGSVNDYWGPSFSFTHPHDSIEVTTLYKKVKSNNGS